MLPQALRQAFSAGFFRDDPESLAVYGKDWSGVVDPRPLAIAFPRTTDEVAQLLRLCSAEKIPVVPSGGRTGLSGGAIAAQGELVVSLEKMNRIGALDPRALTLEVQAGAITQAVHEACAPHGLTWPVDFASKGSSQVGGNISTNAGGVRVIRYGLTRQWVLGLTVVTMSGEILRLNGALEKNNTGADLRQLFIGSEGTLGIVTEAVLKLAPLPREELTRVCFFSLESFARLIELFGSARRAPFVLSAFECLTQECMDEVVRYGLRNPCATPGRIYALVELEERIPGEADAWLESVFSSGLVLDGVMAQSPRERADLWRVREQVAEAILNGRDVHQQDLSVPIASLQEFVSDIETRYSSAYPDFEVFIFGHIGDGNLHIFIRRPLRGDIRRPLRGDIRDPKTEGSSSSREEFHRRCAESDTLLFELTQKFAGSVSAEHGIGLLKKPAIGYSRSSGELALMRAMKSVFDPAGLLNPGKMI